MYGALTNLLDFSCVDAHGLVGLLHGLLNCRHFGVEHDGDDSVNALASRNADHQNAVLNKKINQSEN